MRTATKHAFVAGRHQTEGLFFSCPCGFSVMQISQEDYPQAFVHAVNQHLQMIAKEQHDPITPPRMVPEIAAPRGR